MSTIVFPIPRATQCGQVRAKLQAPSNNPKKIGLPGYAKKYSTCVIAPNGFRTKDGFLTITGAENVGLHPIPLDKRVFKDDQGFCPSSDKAIIKEVRFVPFSNGFKIEVVYDLKKVASKPQHGLNPDLFMALDIGLTNLVTGITNVIGVPPIIFKGGKVKSINQWYNKRAAKLKAAASKKSSSAGWISASYTRSASSSLATLRGGSKASTLVSGTIRILYPCPTIS